MYFHTADQIPTTPSKNQFCATAGSGRYWSRQRTRLEDLRPRRPEMLKRLGSLAAGTLIRIGG
jgi:hypothetical protein